MAVVLSSKSKKRDNQLDRDQELIQKSVKRWQITAESEADSRRQGLEDLKFSIGIGQWDEAVKANREVEGKPCLTVNRAPSFLRQYTGEERQHRPSMLVNPVGSGADIEVAKIHQGVLRHIEVASFADVTYDNSYDMMMRIGWCPWLIKTDYISEMSFQQEPRIVPVHNPFSVYLSPVRNVLGQDPLWAHQVEDLSKEEYKARYGKSQMAQLNFPTDQGNPTPDWVTKAGARVANYWWLDLEPATICQLADGTVKLKKDCSKLELMAVDDERETVTRKVKCIKHNSMEILETYEYLGRYIPLVDLTGVCLNINGRIYKAGMVRDYRDAQRIYDFMVTRQVEQIDAQGKDPLYVPVGGDEGYEEIYRQVNRKNYPSVPYNAYDKEGKQLPPPSRANRNVDIAGMSAIIKQADYDMKAVIGIYGPQVDQPGMQAESGFAILTRQQQSDKGSISWSDNLNRAIRWQGTILLDLWPRYISKPQLQRIVNPDDSVKHAAVYNSQFSEPEDAAGLLDGNAIKKAYDVGKGDYDVTLSAGPMSQTGRQEGFKALTAVITQQPNLFPIVGHLWARNADFNGADELATILKKMLPPQLQDQDPADKDQQIAAQSAQLAQLQQQQQQLVAELARAADTIRTKRLELESKERIVGFQAQAGMIEALIKANVEAGKMAMDHEMSVITDRMMTLHEQIPIEQDAGQPGPTPELPGAVEPKVQPITPAAPVVPVPGTSGGGPQQ
jgi:hypothetical protein